jgi:hypothetical protein
VGYSINFYQEVVWRTRVSTYNRRLCSGC